MTKTLVYVRGDYGGRSHISLVIGRRLDWFIVVEALDLLEYLDSISKLGAKTAIDLFKDIFHIGYDGGSKIVARVLITPTLKLLGYFIMLMKLGRKPVVEVPKGNRSVLSRHVFVEIDNVFCQICNPEEPTVKALVLRGWFAELIVYRRNSTFITTRPYL
jgi:hypothetical protein